MFNSILIILISSLVIYFTGKQFAYASSEIGDYFNLSRSVKGATLDAVASSFPELLIALFSVIFFKEFEIGVGTIAGSVLFNILIIPSLSVLLSPVLFRVSREVMTRDAVFYVLSIVAFLLAVFYSPTWGLSIAIIFIGFYFWYVDLIIDQTKNYQKKKKKTLGAEISVFNKFVSAIVNTVIMGIAAYFLTEHSVLISHILGIPPVIIGFSVVAMATSIPDTIIATVNASRGRIDDVMSNVFGSNIFDILIALGVPLFLSFIVTGKEVNISSGGVDIMIGLVVASLMVFYFIVDDYILTKKNAFIMLLAYVSFVVYLFVKSFV